MVTPTPSPDAFAHTRCKPPSTSARSAIHAPRPCILLAATIVLGLSLPVSAQNLIWENQTNLTDGLGIASGSTYTYNGATVTLTWSITTNSSSTFAYAYGSNYVSYGAGMEGGTSGNVLMGFDNSAFDTNDWITLTLSFSQEQTNLAFSILDIDGFRWTGNRWDDTVEVVYNGSNNVSANTSIWSYASASPVAEQDDEAHFDGWEGTEYSASTDEVTGNINLDFSGISIYSVTIRFSSTDDYNQNPIAQVIGISDLIVVPETRALSAIAAILLILTARRTLQNPTGRTQKSRL